MNIQLFNTEEWRDGECKGVLGEVLIRCNNVLYIRECMEDEDDDEEEGEDKEEGEQIAIEKKEPVKA